MAEFVMLHDNLKDTREIYCDYDEIKYHIEKILKVNKARLTLDYVAVDQRIKVVVRSTVSNDSVIQRVYDELNTWFGTTDVVVGDFSPKYYLYYNKETDMARLILDNEQVSVKDGKLIAVIQFKVLL